MDKIELIEKVNEIELFIWDCGIDSIIAKWDDYADELLERCTYWSNLDEAYLSQAYNEGLKTIKEIDPNKNL